MKEIKAYQCDYCTFNMKTKASVINHENKCFYNPKTKSCATCKHNVLDYETYYNRDHGGNPGSTDFDIKYNWCEKIDIELRKGTLTTNCELWEGE